MKHVRVQIVNAGRGFDNVVAELISRFEGDAGLELYLSRFTVDR